MRRSVWSLRLLWWRNAWSEDQSRINNIQGWEILRKVGKTCAKVLGWGRSRTKGRLRKKVSVAGVERTGVLWARKGRSRPEHSMLFYHLLSTNQYSLCFKHFISFISLSLKQLLEVSAFIINFTPKEPEAKQFSREAKELAKFTRSVVELKFEPRSHWLQGQTSITISIFILKATGYNNSRCCQWGKLGFKRYTGLLCYFLQLDSNLHYFKTKSVSN